MDAGVIITIVLAFSGLIGLPIALWNLRKSGSRKVQELYEHLLAIGIKAYMIPEFAQNNRPKKFNFFQRVAGTIGLQKCQIEFIDVIGTAQQYGVNYSIHYLIYRPGLVTTETRQRRTKLKKKGKPQAPLASAEYVWEGNDLIARKLNSHAETGVAVQQEIFKGGIEILSESGDEYVKIKTEYILPDKNQFDIMEIIAKVLKS